MADGAGVQTAKVVVANAFLPPRVLGPEVVKYVESLSRGSNHRSLHGRRMGVDGNVGTIEQVIAI